MNRLTYIVLWILFSYIRGNLSCEYQQGYQVVSVCRAMTCGGRYVVITSENVTTDAATCSCDVTVTYAEKAVVEYSGPGNRYCGMYYYLDDWWFGCDDGFISLAQGTSRLKFHKSATATSPASTFRMSVDMAYEYGIVIVICYDPGTAITSPMSTTDMTSSSTGTVHPSKSSSQPSSEKPEPSITSSTHASTNTSSTSSYNSPMSKSSSISSSGTVSYSTKLSSSPSSTTISSETQILSRTSSATSTTVTYTSSTTSTTLETARNSSFTFTHVRNTTTTYNSSTSTPDSTPSSKSASSSVSSTTYSATSSRTSSQAPNTQTNSSNNSSTTFQPPVSTGTKGSPVSSTDNSQNMSNYTIGSTESKSSNKVSTSPSSTGPVTSTVSASNRNVTMTTIDTSITPKPTGHRNITVMDSKELPERGSSKSVDRKVLLISVGGGVAAVTILVIIVLILVTIRSSRRRGREESLTPSRGSYIDAFNDKEESNVDIENIFATPNHPIDDHTRPNVRGAHNPGYSPSFNSVSSVSSESVTHAYQWGSTEEREQWGFIEGTEHWGSVEGKDQDVSIEGTEQSGSSERPEQLESVGGVEAKTDAPVGVDKCLHAAGQVSTHQRDDMAHIYGPVNSDVYAIVTRNTDVKLERHVSPMSSFRQK